jgi:methylenetetrahydrofolate dehydrogenase (NADP+)/methenyltetrahydrofolate cyclohydrolase
MILSGTKLAKRFNRELKTKIEQLDLKPQLTAVLVGDNPASLRYIRQKQKACESA